MAAPFPDAYSALEGIRPFIERMRKAGWTINVALESSPWGDAFTIAGAKGDAINGPAPHPGNGRQGTPDPQLDDRAASTEVHPSGGDTGPVGSGVGEVR